MQLSIIGIDLGKTSCSLVGLDAAGKVVVRRRMRRDTVVEFCSKVPACVVAMEACCGAHHIGRALAAQGHEIRLMSPEYVRPYVKAQKNDDRDAEAIAEAASRPTMRFVTLKSEEQLDMQTLHRVRDRLVGDQTSLMNQVRSLLLERGHVVAQGRAQLAAALAKLLDGEQRVLASRIHELIADMRRQWVALDERIKAFDAEFAAAAKAQDGAKRLLSIPGIGALNATALVAAVGDAGTFARGRDLAAWLGLVPRQVTTGGRPKLRFHPAALYREASGDPRRTFPALLAPVTDLSGTLTGVHRTFLDPDPGPTSDPGRLGKAPVASPRRSLGRLAGHGVRLRPGDGSAWLVGEGLETVMSLAPLLPDVCIVAALSAAHLAMLTLPTGLTTLIIACDNDAAGRGAAERLREQAEGASIAVTVLRPRLIDFNADLRRWGSDGLQSRVFVQLQRGG